MKKATPPSRRRYEEKNPTVSFRLPGEFKEQLDAHLSWTGFTLRQFVENSLHGWAADVDHVFRQGYERGFMDGLVHGADTIMAVSDLDEVWEEVLRVYRKDQSRPGRGGTDDKAWQEFVLELAGGRQV